MLHKVVHFAETAPKKAEKQAQEITEGIGKPEISFQEESKNKSTISQLHTLWKHWKSSIDYIDGGTKGAPKFPLPVGYFYLLKYLTFSKASDVRRAICVTLQKMANGGIYDQIGGGFCRYSTDVYWIAPHFEKMLYDNGQLVSLYAEAYRFFKETKYASVVKETLDFVKGELYAPEGLFYSSLDADSEGVEGKFYVWKYDELQAHWGKNAPLLMDYYNITPQGNWEHKKNILYITETATALSEKHTLTIDEIKAIVKKEKATLLKQRNNRVRPRLDDKILTSWNALMLKGFVDASIALGTKEYLDTAIKGAMVIKSKLTTSEHALYRNFKDGVPAINGFLDDYAYTIDLYLHLYQATFDEMWLQESIDLKNHLFKHFLDHQSNLFYFTSDLDPALITRNIEVVDNVTPSGNSQMARNLFLLGTILNDEKVIRHAELMLGRVQPRITGGTQYFANWASLQLDFLQQPAVVTITGGNAQIKRAQMGQHSPSNTIFVGGTSPGTLIEYSHRTFEKEATIYVCRGKTCEAPTMDVSEALLHVQQEKEK